jgi:hypothetical protein
MVYDHVTTERRRPSRLAASPRQGGCVALGLGLLAALTAMVGLAAPAAAHGGAAFDHVGTFNVPDNLRSAEPGSTVTSAEIVAAGPGGRSLV